MEAIVVVIEDNQWSIYQEFVYYHGAKKNVLLI